MANLATDPLHPTDPLFSEFRSPLGSQLFYREYNEAGSEGEGDKGDEGDGGEEDKGDKGDDGTGTDKGNDDKGSKDTEGRISDLVKKNKELEKKLKEKEDADKKAAEDKLKEEGKLKELLETKESELSELTGTSETMKSKLESYEKIAEEQINSALESIEDEERREDAKAMLEGRDLSEQFNLLPKLLKLAGQQANSFGGSTPAGQGAGASSKEQKQARYKELLDKEDLKPAERAEMNKLMFELSNYTQSES